MKKNNKNIDKKLVKSVNKNIRSSTRKLKPILKSIVGKKVDIAIRDLSFSEKRISKDIKKTISSAIANAENNYQYDIDNLSATAQKVVEQLRGLDQVINEKNNISALLVRAKKAYIADLKSEMLSRKAGFDFSE